MQKQVATTWLAAATAHYASAPEWRTWADNLILAMSTPPNWIIDVSLARDATELREALVDRLDTEWNPDRSPTFDELFIGFIWLTYKRGQLSLEECLTVAGEQADGGLSSIECEVFYDLLNRLESGERSSSVESDAAARFSSVVEIAQGRWDELTRPDLVQSLLNGE